MNTYSHVRYLYLRDSNRNPYSCVAVRLDRENNLITYQVATFSSKETAPFTKDLARHIACQRLNQACFKIEADLSNLNTHEITRMVMQDIASTKDHYEADVMLVDKNELTWDNLRMVSGFPQRTRKGAKNWLKNHLNEHPTFRTIPCAEVHQSNVDDSGSEDPYLTDNWDPAVPVPPVAPMKEIENVSHEFINEATARFSSNVFIKTPDNIDC